MENNPNLITEEECTNGQISSKENTDTMLCDVTADILKRYVLHNNMWQMLCSTFSQEADQSNETRATIIKLFTTTGNEKSVIIDYDCNTTHTPGEQIAINIQETMSDKRNSLFAKNYTYISAMYDNGIFSTEVFSNHLCNGTMVRAAYVDKGLVIYEEAYSGITTPENNYKYSSDDTSIINDLGIIDSDSPLIKRAIEESMPFSSTNYYDLNDSTTAEIFESPEGLKYTFFFVSADGKAAYIEGDSETANVEYYLRDGEEATAISADEFINGREDNELIQRFEDTISKLRQHGIIVDGYEDDFEDTAGEDDFIGDIEPSQKLSDEKPQADSSGSNGGKPYILRKPTTDNK